MPDIKRVLQDEISRLARKEVKQAVQPLLKQVRELKRTSSQQKREIARLEKELAEKSDKAPDAQITPSEDSSDEPVRITTRSVKAQRKRLGLSQKQMALLLGVNPLTISSWENGKNSPRGQNRMAFAELRNMDAEEVEGRLEELEKAQA